MKIDVNITEPPPTTVKSHEMFPRIRLIEGSSTAPETLAHVQQLATGRQSVLVCLDSNHTHGHVLRELQLYSPLVTLGSYLVVFDTIIEDLPPDMFPDRPWGPGNNPKTAVYEFLKTTDHFQIDRDIDSKLLITVCPNGFLRRALS